MPDENWSCPELDPEDFEWVKDCRAGRLHYPDRHSNEYATISSTLPWIKHMEHWTWTASDVTHVYADAERYKDPFKTVGRYDSNELFYALKYGSILSGKYTV